MAKLTGFVAGAIAAGALATTGLGSAPPAQATCASFFGIGNSMYCKSSQTSIAIAIGAGAIAHANGLLGAAFSVGTSADAVTLGAATLAVAVGDASRAAGYGLFGIAMQLGPRGIAATTGLDGSFNNPGFNIALNISPGTTSAAGSLVEAFGMGNIAVNLFGIGTTPAGHYAEATGNLNAVIAVGGIDNRVVGTGAFDGAFSIFGKHNIVVASPGPFAVAGSILQTGQTIKKQEPGINVNGYVAGGAAAVGSSGAAAQHAGTSRAAHSAPHSARPGKKT